MGIVGLQGLNLDREFELLSVVLTEDEYRDLESRIRQEGCREPLHVWGNTLIDGYSQYRICSDWGVHFCTRSMEFSDRNEAIAWVCTRHLNIEKVPVENRRYLIGKLYDAEKGRRAAKELAVCAAGDWQDDITEGGENAYEFPEKQKISTAERIARGYQLSSSAVNMYAIYSRDLDMIGRRSATLVRKILCGKMKITRRYVSAIARMDVPSISTLEELLDKQMMNDSFVPYKVTSEEIDTYLKNKEPPVLHTEIKNMPAYDPDAEVNGLILTVTTWKGFIRRMHEKANPDRVSPEAMRRMGNVLRELMEEMNSVLQKIKE